MTPLRNPQSVWWSNRHEVVAFAKVLNEQGLFTPPGSDDATELLLDYFYEPWTRSFEYEWWVFNRRTSDLLIWDAAGDAGYPVEYGQIA